MVGKSKIFKGESGSMDIKCQSFDFTYDFLVKLFSSLIIISKSG